MSRTAMPIMGSTLLREIPWSLIAPHEKQAQANHGQSLKRLAERGGLSAAEALCIIEDRKWGYHRNGIAAEACLLNKVTKWRSEISENHRETQP